MAFTEDEKLRIAELLQTDYVAVNDQIFNLGAAYITAAVEAQVREYLDEWFEGGAGSDTTVVEPNDKNFGARIDPEKRRAQIRLAVSGKLYLKPPMSGGIRLVRG